MFCPNCGKQNKDDVASCAFCGHGLEKPKPRFKGTMMMNAPAGPPPPRPAAAPPQPSAPPPAPPARSPKKTMVGGFAVPPGGPTPPPPAKPAAPAAPARSPKKTMVGGFAVPPGGPTPPPAAKPPAAPAARESAAEAPSGPVQAVGGAGKNPAFQKTIVGGMPAMAPPPGGGDAPPPASPEASEAPAASAAPAAPAWSGGDEDTPPGGLSGPVQAGGRGASKNLAFQNTMVGGMPAMPPAPSAEAASAPAEPASRAAPPEEAQPAPADEPVSERRAPRLDVAPRESLPEAPPVKAFGGKLALFALLGLGLAAGGAYAIGVKIGAFGVGSPQDAIIDTHRFWLRGQLQMVRFTCAEDPSGVTAAAALGLPEGSALGAEACKVSDAALAAFNDPSRSPGAVLENPPRSIETADGRIAPTTCVAFTSGDARVVTCAAGDTKLQIADVRGLDAIE